VRSMHWEIGLTFQCSGLICSVSQMKSGLLLRLSWVPYTGFLLHCSPIRASTIFGTKTYACIFGLVWQIEMYAGS
jgi:hypothetical protein